MELYILQASENLEKYQQETRKWRDKKVVKKNITVGDWVLKRKPNAETFGKLNSKWEGTFPVTKSNRPGSYHLSDTEGNELQHPWNADSLKKYYIWACKKAASQDYKRLRTFAAVFISFYIVKGRTLFLTSGNSILEVRFLTRRTRCKLIQYNEFPPKKSAPFA